MIFATPFRHPETDEWSVLLEIMLLQQGTKLMLIRNASLLATKVGSEFCKTFLEANLSFNSFFVVQLTVIS